MKYISLNIMNALHYLINESIEISNTRGLISVIA